VEKHEILSVMKQALEKKNAMPKVPFIVIEKRLKIVMILIHEAPS
jgi:hypothetical protein